MLCARACFVISNALRFSSEAAAAAVEAAPGADMAAQQTRALQAGAAGQKEAAVPSAATQNNREGRVHNGESNSQTATQQSLHARHLG